MAEVAKARSQGWALADQEVELGLRSLAVPVLDTRGRVVAALNTGMAAVASDPAEAATALLPALLKVQEGLRRVLR